MNKLEVFYFVTILGCYECSQRKFRDKVLPWNCLCDGMCCSIVYALIYLSRIFLGLPASQAKTDNKEKDISLDCI